MHRAITLAIILSLLPAAASARCRNGDLEGRYALSAETRGDLGTFWTICELQIGADGTIQPGTNCLQRDAEGAEAQAKVDGGTISVRRSCRISGSIVIAGYESVVIKARMTRDKSIVKGKAENPHDGSEVRFSAERQVGMAP